MARCRPTSFLGAMPITPDSVLLTGRFAVVTGGAAGIGAAIAVALARFGADVAICDRDEEGLERVATEIRAAGRAATPSCSTSATPTRCARGSRRSTGSTSSSTTRAAGFAPTSST